MKRYTVGLVSKMTPTKSSNNKLIFAWLERNCFIVFKCRLLCYLSVASSFLLLSKPPSEHTSCHPTSPPYAFSCLSPQLPKRSHSLHSVAVCNFSPRQGLPAPSRSCDKERHAQGTLTPSILLHSWPKADLKPSLQDRRLKRPTHCHTRSWSEKASILPACVTCKERIKTVR